MKYRVVKKQCWWSSVFDTEQPQFLYYDSDLEHYEVASYSTARKHVFHFTKNVIELLKREEGFENEFFVENVREEGDAI